LSHGGKRKRQRSSANRQSDHYIIPFHFVSKFFRICAGVDPITGDCTNILLSSVFIDNVRSDGKHGASCGEVQKNHAIAASGHFIV
jgi:hypothetical protein